MSAVIISLTRHQLDLLERLSAGELYVTSNPPHHNFPTSHTSRGLNCLMHHHLASKLTTLSNITWTITQTGTAMLALARLLTQNREPS